MSRRQRNQSTHDNRVRTLANRLEIKVGRSKLTYRTSINLIQSAKMRKYLTSLQLEAPKLRLSKLKLPVPLILIKISTLPSDVVLLTERMGNLNWLSHNPRNLDNTSNQEVNR